MLRARHAESVLDGFVNHMDSIRFDPSDHARFAELWPQYEACADSSRVLRPPNRILAAMEVLLEELQAKICVPKALKPDWLASMVDHRDAFAGTAFYSDSLHLFTGVVYKLLLAIAKPRRVMLMECRKSPLGSCGMTAYVCCEYESLRFVDHTLVPWEGVSDISVLPVMRCCGSEVHMAGREEPSLASKGTGRWLLSISISSRHLAAQQVP